MSHAATPRPLRLVMACLPSMGGSAITAVALAEGLAGRGHVVHMVASDPPYATGLTRSRTSAGTAVVRGVTYHWVDRTPHPVLDAGAVDVLRLADLLGRTAVAVDADVVNPHYLGALLPAAHQAVATFHPRAALVASAHGTDITDPAPGTLALTGRILTQCAALTVVSGYLLDTLADHGLVPVQVPVTVIPNWVEPPPAPVAADGCHAGGDELLLAHVSNFRPVKRAVRCVDALAAAQAVRPTRLLLVGDGPDLAGVHARAAELGVTGQVTAVGRVDPDTASRMLADADLVLLPSESEGCSGVLLQSLAAGVPAVAYDVGGNSGVTADGRTGVLVPDEDEAAGFAAAVAELAGDEETRRRLGRAALRDAGRFTAEATLDAYEQVFAAAATRTTTG